MRVRASGGGQFDHRRRPIASSGSISTIDLCESYPARMLTQLITRQLLVLLAYSSHRRHPLEEWKGVDRCGHGGLRATSVDLAREVPW